MSRKNPKNGNRGGYQLPRMQDGGVPGVTVGRCCSLLLDEFQDFVNVTALAGQTVTHKESSCAEASNLLLSEQRDGVQLKEFDRSLPPVVCNAIRVAKLATTKGPIATAINVFWWGDPTLFDVMQTDSTRR